MTPRMLVRPLARAFEGNYISLRGSAINDCGILTDTASSLQNPLAALSLNPSKTTARAGSTEARERRKHEPYLQSLSRQRKAANLSRRKVLAEERKTALGDPVESKPTDFVQQIKTQSDPEEKTSTFDGNANHFLTEDNLDTAFAYSKDLTSPVRASDRDTVDPQLHKEAMEKHSQNHTNAEEAVRRIVNLNSGSHKDRLRANIITCIQKFGRHETDSHLPPKPAAQPPPGTVAYPEKTPRVGTDTGSPEVQVAILTAKILNLSRHLEGTKKDLHNKRNLRLLVHRRQKMLKYLRRKERGGPRYQWVMENLGLSDAAWKGEITL